MPVVFHFRAISEWEAHASKNVDDFLFHDRKRVTRAQRNGVGRASEIEMWVIFFGGGKFRFEVVEARLECIFQLVDVHTHFTLLICCNIAEIRHELVNKTFLAQVFQAKCFELFVSLCRKARHFCEQLLDFLYHDVNFYRERGSKAPNM